MSTRSFFTIQVKIVLFSRFFSLLALALLPIHARSECVNNPEFSVGKTGGNKEQDCKWIRSKEKRRQKYCLDDSEDGVVDTAPRYVVLAVKMIQPTNSRTRKV